MAQVINRKSPSILNCGKSSTYAFITCKKKFIFISKPAALICGAMPNKYIHFINDSNYWAFYINDDPDGFELKQCSKRSGGYFIYNAHLSLLFKNSVGAKDGQRFFIFKTESNNAGNPIFEIQTTAPVSVILDKVTRMNAQKEIEKNYVLRIAKPYRPRKGNG